MGPGQESSAAARRTSFLAALLVILFAAVPLLPTLGNGFLYDDEVLLGVVWPSWRQILSTDLFGTNVDGSAASGYYRPVVRASYRLEADLHGASGPWFHAVNLLLQAGVALLLWRTLLRIAPTRAFALPAAILFAAHPIHSESICMITGRTDPLALLFVLAGTLTALRGRLLAPICLFAIAQLCKESAAAMLPLLAAAPLAWDAPLARRRAHVLRLLLGGGLVVAAFFLLKVQVLGIVPPADVFTGDGTTGQRLLTFIAAIPRYLGLLFWPEHLSITHYFPLVETARDVRLWLGVGTLVLLAAVATFGRPPLMLGTVIFLLTLAPASNLVPITYAFADIPFPLFERYLYVPSVGICLIAAVLLCDVARRFAPLHAAPAGVAAAVLLAIPLGARQWQRALDYRSSATLYASAMRGGSTAVEVELAHAGALYREGRFGDALKAYDAFLAAHPESVAGRLEHASVLADLAEQYRQHAERHAAEGRADLAAEVRAHSEPLLQLARKDCDDVLAAEPDNGWAMEVKGAVVGIGGDLLEAARLLTRASTMQGTTNRLGQNLNYVAWRLRDRAWQVAQGGVKNGKEAIFLYEQGLRALTGSMPPREIQKPVFAIVIKMMCEHADQLVLSGKAVQAASAYRWILSHDPTQSRAHEGLGFLANQAGDRSEAYLQLKAALSIDPEAFYALSEMFNMLMADGQVEEAAEYHRRYQRLLEEHQAPPQQPPYADH